jgi:heme-degrading monooxygenase HmoA
MIARFWRGYAIGDDADKYQHFLLTTFLPSLHRLKGYEGARVLRNDEQQEIEFIVLTFWESFEAVREFAGPNLRTPVIATEAERLLSRYDKHPKHYKIWESK